jgi:hypothetical protein
MTQRGLALGRGLFLFCCPQQSCNSAFGRKVRSHRSMIRADVGFSAKAAHFNAPKYSR